MKGVAAAIAAASGERALFLQNLLRRALASDDREHKDALIAQALASLEAGPLTPAEAHLLRVLRWLGAPPVDAWTIDEVGRGWGTLASGAPLAEAMRGLAGRAFVTITDDGTRVALTEAGHRASS